MKRNSDFPSCLWRLFSVTALSFLGVMGAVSLSPAKSLIWDEFIPSKYHQKIEASLKGKTSELYAMTPDSPIEVELRGPRKVLVHVRDCFKGGEESMKEYRLNVLLDDRNFDEYSFRSGPTPLATLLGENPDKLKIGALRKIILEIPEGVHRLKFTSSDAKDVQPLFLKFFVSEILSEGEKHVAMSPEKYDQVVDMIYKEKEITYYRMTPECAIQLSLVGPTELKVITRLEFNHRMKGKYSYQIQVFEDDHLIQTRQYRTYKSDAISYQKVSRVTSGRSRSFLISVRKGKHVYRLVPVTLQKETVIAKILIPRKDVGVVED